MPPPGPILCTTRPHPMPRGPHGPTDHHASCSVLFMFPYRSCHRLLTDSFNTLGAMRTAERVAAFVIAVTPYLAAAADDATEDTAADSAAAGDVADEDKPLLDTLVS